VGYDEVAHHSGVESEDALDILRKLDEQFARLESAAQQAPALTTLSSSPITAKAAGQPSCSVTA
jgi:hypothetical protein